MSKSNLLYMKCFNWFSKFIKIRKWIIKENAFLRFLIILLIDLFIFIFSFFLIFSDHINKENYLESLLFFSELILISYVVYFFSGQYKSLIRYVGSKSFYPLAYRNLLITITLSFFINVFQIFQCIYVLFNVCCCQYYQSFHSTIYTGFYFMFTSLIMKFFWI